MVRTTIFITLQDHKENFNFNPIIRVTISVKNGMGSISKMIFHRVSKNIQKAMNWNWWRNTDRLTEDTQLHQIIIFNTAEFHLSITENMLKKAFPQKVLLDKGKAIITIQWLNHYYSMTSKLGLEDLTIRCYNGRVQRGGVLWFSW